MITASHTLKIRPLLKASIAFYREHFRPLLLITWPLTLTMIGTAITAFLPAGLLPLISILSALTAFASLLVNILLVRYIEAPDLFKLKPELKKAFNILPTFTLGLVYFVFRIFIRVFIGIILIGFLVGILLALKLSNLVFIICVAVVSIALLYWVLRSLTKANFFHFELILRSARIKDSFRLSSHLSKHHVNRVMVLLWPMLASQLLTSLLPVFAGFVAYGLSLPWFEQLLLLLLAPLGLMVSVFGLIYDQLLFNKLRATDPYKQAASLPIKTTRFPNRIHQIAVGLVLIFSFVYSYAMYSNPLSKGIHENSNSMFKVLDMFKNFPATDSDSDEMDLAMMEARARIDEFITAYQSPQLYQDGFYIKTEFKHDDMSEWMWVYLLGYDPDTEVFEGIVTNEPEYIDSVSYLDKVSIAKADVGDWKYYEYEKFVGFFTLEPLLKAEEISYEDFATNYLGVPPLETETIISAITTQQFADTLPISWNRSSYLTDGTQSAKVNEPLVAANALKINYSVLEFESTYGTQPSMVVVTPKTERIHDNLYDVLNIQVYNPKTHELYGYIWPYDENGAFLTDRPIWMESSSEVLLEDLLDDSYEVDFDKVEYPEIISDSSARHPIL